MEKLKVVEADIVDTEYATKDQRDLFSKICDFYGEKIENDRCALIACKYHKDGKTIFVKVGNSPWEGVR